MTHDIQMAFRVIKFDCSPDAITRILGVPPSDVWNIGELRHPAFLLKNEFSGWELVSGLPETSEFKEHLDQMLLMIRQFADRLNVLPTECALEIRCGIVVPTGDDQYLPWIHLNREHVQMLCEWGIEFDIDLTYYPE